MMDVQKMFVNLQIDGFEFFKSQNLEGSNFDVVFEIDGKKLYAHKCMLCQVSATFNSMLSDRWTKPGEVVKIFGYFYDDFNEFLTFIYCGKCQLTNKNIFTMVDIAEFYAVQELKDVCDEYLINTKLNIENVFQMMEFANKYSLMKFKNSVNKYIKQNFSMVLKNEQFLFLQKSAMKDFVDANQETKKQEELFESVSEWAENRAIEKQKLDQSLNIKEIIKDELSEILPLFQFEKMNSVFLIKFVVKKSFLFSGDELSDILWARNRTFVKVIDKNGKLMEGKIQCDDIETVANVIQSKKDQGYAYCDVNCCYWITKQPKPSPPSKLIKNDKIEWYLVFEDEGDLAIKRRKVLIESDYLLAEMSAEDGFDHYGGCKIEIF